MLTRYIVDRCLQEQAVQLITFVVVKCLKFQVFDGGKAVFGSCEKLVAGLGEGDVVSTSVGQRSRSLYESCGLQVVQEAYDVGAFQSERRVKVALRDLLAFTDDGQCDEVARAKSERLEDRLGANTNPAAEVVHQGATSSWRLVDDRELLHVSRVAACPINSTDRE